MISGDVATISADDILDLRLVRSQEFLQIFRIKAGGESRRAHEVAKHHRELSPFGVIAEPWAGLVCRRRRRELANGVEDFPPMADSQDSDLLEIVGGQAEQDVEVDPVVAKCLLVGLQAEAAQPLPDVHVASARLRRMSASSRRARYAFGRTFWFSRNRLPGSYLAFSAASRA